MQAALTNTNSVSGILNRENRNGADTFFDILDAAVSAFEKGRKKVTPISSRRSTDLNFTCSGKISGERYSCTPLFKKRLTLKIRNAGGVGKRMLIAGSIISAPYFGIQDTIL